MYFHFHSFFLVVISLVGFNENNRKTTEKKGKKKTHDKCVKTS